jgi:hypothetical protein
MRIRRRLILLVWSLAMSIACSALAADYPPLPAPSGDTSHWGANIRRTMRLLETSTAEKPNRVRILFYGQSIMGGRWSAHVEKYLREKYPHAILETENRALGGFAAQMLIRTCDADLYPFQPDLMVFHVYGDHNRYEEIIHNTRQRTVAEIMIMTDHWPANSYQDGRYVSSDWAEFYDKTVLPAVAKRYQCELVDARWAWKDYLEANQLTPPDVLKDNVHLNDHGLWLMARLCVRQLVYRPELVGEVSTSPVKDYPIGPGGLEWKDGQLDFEFEGNRVEIVTHSAGGPALAVLLDGRAPSQTPEFYTHTRTTGLIPPETWPTVYRVSSKSLPVAETWELEILEIDEAQEKIRFKVTGSVTGFDGEGTNLERFESRSGRVVIEPEDWGVNRSFKLKKTPARVGMKSFWRCEFHGTDTVIPPDDLSAPGRETTTLLFAGGTRAKRRLQLTAHGEMREVYRALRVYSPPIPAGDFSPMGLSPKGESAANDTEILRPDTGK